MRRWWVIASALLGLGLTGCPGDPEDPDAGPPDAGPPAPAALVGFGATRDALTAADFACTPTEPSRAGAATTFDLRAEDFQENLIVAGLQVQFFSDNVIPADFTCGAGCTEGATNAEGNLSVTSTEGAWYAYRIQAGMATYDGRDATFVQIVQYNEDAPAAGMFSVANAVRASTQTTITGLLNIQQDDANGIITGQVSDCGGNPIANAQVRIFNDAGQIAFGNLRTDTQDFYYNGMSFPSAPEVMTNVDGLYGAGNIPIPANGRIRVEIWGSTAAGSAAEMLGCEAVQVVPNGITIINVGPTRTDGPADCSG